MAPRCTRAAALAALIACLAAPAAPAQDPTGELPPLTDAPEGLGEREPTPTPTPTATPQPTPSPAPDEEAEPREELANTGSEPLVLALAGLGLLTAGAGLRRTADDLVGP